MHGGLRVIFFDIGQTLTASANISPRRLLGNRLGLNEKETKLVGRLIMTYPATEYGALVEPLHRIVPRLPAGQIESVLEEVWLEQKAAVKEQENAISALTFLKKIGASLGIISNTWHPLFSGFWENCPEMAQLMDFSILSYLEGCKKPSLDLFRLAMERAGKSAGECWMVGDSYELDIEPAKRSGMRTVWVLRHPEKEKAALAQILRGELEGPDEAVEHLIELEALFRRQ